MLFTSRLIIGFVLLTVAVGCRPGAAPEISEADKAAVRAQMEKYVAAANAADWEAWGNTLATDVVAMPPNSAPLQGREAAVNWAKSLPKIANLTATADEVTGRGDLAYARGTYSFTATQPDGSSMNDKGSFLQIHTRQADGTWPFTRMIWHSDLPPSAASTDPRIGTWTLNVAKSKFSPGPPPKSQTLTVEPSGTGERVTNNTISAEGTQSQTQYTANYDGNETPLTGAPSPTTVSLRRIDSHRTERIDKRDGKTVLTIMRVVSPDGKTMTATIKGVDEKGRALNNVVIFEKQ
jgi:ketosteroid isomerase-like protein